MAVPPSQVLLGSIVFTQREVPDTMPWGGKQKLAIHKQLGGKRAIDAMGPDPRAITWKGLFYGPTASIRARMVDSLKDAGGAVGLQWGTFAYIVVISDFDADYQHEWFVHYNITCEVVAQGPSLPAPNLDRSLSNDFNSLGGITKPPTNPSTPPGDASGTPVDV